MDFSDFDHSEFLKIISGEEFYLKRAYRKKKFCKITCPIIIISNNPPIEKFKHLFNIVESRESIC